MISPGIATSNPGLAKLIIGLIFPVGLTMVTISGAELYTGNTAVVTTALYEKKATLGQLIRNWVVSYSANFIGSLIMVAAIVSTGILDGNTMAIKMAEAKTSLPWATVSETT